jgi:hypothetical protein
MGSATGLAVGRASESATVFGSWVGSGSATVLGLGSGSESAIKSLTVLATGSG